MTLPILTEYFSDRTETLPFADGDADILLDITFSDYADVAAFEAAYNGQDASHPDFTVANPSNAVFSANGFTGYHATTNPAFIHTSGFTAGSDALTTAREGTLLFQVDRAAFTTPNSALISTTFIQSEGTVTATNRTLFAISTTSNTNRMRMRRNASTNNALTFECITGGVNAHGGNCYPNSQIPNGLDDTMQIVITWKNSEVFVLIDGMLADYALQPGPIIDAGRFGRFIIGATDTSGTHPMFLAANYNIQRVQIAKRAAIPAWMPIRMAYIGDSFSQNASAASSYDIVDAHLAGLRYFAGTAAPLYGFGPYVYKGGQEFSRLCMNAGLGIPSWIHATTTTGGGHHWEKDAAASSLWESEKDAMITVNPEIIIAFQCIGDTDAALPATPAALLAEVLTYFDAWIDGCSNLRQIHYFEQFPGLNGSSSYSVAARHTKSEARRAALAGADGYRGIVHYHPTRMTWDESFGVSTHPDNAIGSATGNTFSANNDIHPSSLGHLAIGKIVFDAIYPYLKRLPT